MKEYWFIFLIAILCAIFSKQIDSIVSRIIKNKKNRTIFYIAFCSVMLAVIVFILYSVFRTYYNFRLG